MGRYLDLAKTDRERRTGAGISLSATESCEKSPGTFKSEWTTPLRDRAFKVLIRIHSEHETRLQGRSIARVMLSVWREAVGLDEVMFRRIVNELERSTAIIREHGYARPNPNSRRSPVSSREEP